ncbi:hypothetical protein SASPL_157423 [Salvia splendens]|uniref:non-specific serine/threonine protein kinase n=1 Tax=Salvia splendens TaxID=180675 RepID=A0A8X8YU79_SALSN|nr:hypothetical protein SASPL_157423 [Salvia splendens]
MGQCYGKTIPTVSNDEYPTTDLPPQTPPPNGTPARSSAANSAWPPTRRRRDAGGVSPCREVDADEFFKKPFPPPSRRPPPPSPAKHIRASLRKLGNRKKSPRHGAIPEDAAEDAAPPQQQHHALDKNFGYNKNFGAKYELGKEVGRGHFGHTCFAKGRKGELKDLPLAVKIISKSKIRETAVWQMTTAISVEDVRREVKILKALSGHRHLVRFYDACEDSNNVYIIMEYVSLFPLCCCFSMRKSLFREHPVIVYTNSVFCSLFFLAGCVMVENCLTEYWQILIHLSDVCKQNTDNSLFISEVVGILKKKQNLLSFRFLALSHLSSSRCCPS